MHTLPDPLGLLELLATVSSAVASHVASAAAKYPGYTLIATGHSLGAALAGIAATVLRKDGYSVQLVSASMLVFLQSDCVRHLYQCDF